jgi:hypothetical protein
MHPPEADGPADRSDAAQNERHCFEILHVKLRYDDCENPQDAGVTIKNARGPAAGVSVSADDSRRCNYGLVVVVVVSFVSYDDSGFASVTLVTTMRSPSFV